MKKQWFLVVMIFLLVPWLLAGCGIAQDVYDAVVSDLSKAQQELQSVKAELDKMKADLVAAKADLSNTEAELTTAKADLSNAEAELMTAKTDFEAAQADVQEYQSRLAEAHAYAQILDVDFDVYRLEMALPTKYGWVGPGKSPDWIRTYKSQVSAAGDTELSQMVVHAFSLPWGSEKDIAWVEFYLRLAELLVATTKP